MSVSLIPGVDAAGRLFANNSRTRRNLAQDLNVGYTNPLNYLDSTAVVDGPVAVPTIDGTDDVRGAFAAADTDGPMLLPPGTYRIGTSLTITKHVTFMDGAKILAPSGVVVTLAGGYTAPLDAHVFDVSEGGRIWSTGKSKSSQYHWGAVGDATYNAVTGVSSGTNDTVAIQTYIDNEMYFSKSGYVELAPGRHLITTIHLGYGDTFRQVILTGPREVSTYVANAGVVLFTNTYENAIEIQGGRYTTVDSINLTGPWAAHIFNSDLGATIPATVVPANWVPAGAPADAQDRYKYSCGIHVDPRSGVKPATHYTDVNYPQDLPGVTLTTQYGKNISGSPKIKNCVISGFGIGVAVQGCDANTNGDFLTIEACRISECFTGISWGNNQGRLVTADQKTFIFRCYQVASNRLIGQQNGECQLRVTSCFVGLCAQLIDIQNANIGTAVTFQNCAGEVMWRIGEFSTTGSFSGCLEILGSEFSFSQEGMPIPESILRTRNAMFHTTGSMFQGLTSPFIIDGPPERTRFASNIVISRNSYWATGGASLSAENRAKAIAHNSTCGVMFLDRNQGPWEGGYDLTTYNISTLVAGPGTCGKNFKSSVTQVIPFCVQQVTGTTQSINPIPVHLGYFALSRSTGNYHSVEHVDRTLTIIFQGAVQPSIGTLSNNGLNAGSIWYAENEKTLFVVISHTWGSTAFGNRLTVVAQQLNRFNQATGAHDVQLTTGSLIFTVPAGFYHPATDAEVTWTSGSTAVTFATPDGVNTHQAQFPVGACKAVLGTANSLTPILDAGSNITASSAGSLTMSGNARRTTVDRAGIWIVPKT